MKKLFLILFFFLNFNNLLAETKIAYIDINYILNNSIVGKSISEHIKSIEKKKISEFNLIEKSLLEREKNIISKKNIIEENDFNKQIDALKNEITKYNNDKNKFIDEINNDKIKYTKIVLNTLNQIISNYVEENLITIVFSKKDVVVAKKNLDITDSVMNVLNDSLKEIEF